MIFLSALIALTLAPVNNKALPTPKSDFYFVALGDNRPAAGGLPPTSNFRQILREVGVLGPSFVLSTGDLLYGNEESVDQYQQEIKSIKPLLNDLPCPFYNVPGNHEVAKHEFITLYQRGLGALYGDFEYGGFRFIGVCTELAPTGPGVKGEELDWLKAELTNRRPTVIFEHHPVFKRESNTEEGAAIEDGAAMHALYKSGGVKAVFEGHDHVYNRQEHDGITYTISGGAGAPMDAGFEQNGSFHYVLVHVSGTQFVETPIPMGALEIVQVTSGCAVAADYADVDLPITNLRISTTFEPGNVEAAYTSKGQKTISVSAKISSIEKTNDGYVSRIALVVPKHRAVLVRVAH